MVKIRRSLHAKQIPCGTFCSYDGTNVITLERYSQNECDVLGVSPGFDHSLVGCDLTQILAEGYG